MWVITRYLTFQRKIVILLSLLKLWQKNKSTKFCKKIDRKFDFRIESTFNAKNTYGNFWLKSKKWKILNVKIVAKIRKMKLPFYKFWLSIIFRFTFNLFVLCFTSYYILFYLAFDRILLALKHLVWLDFKSLKTLLSILLIFPSIFNRSLIQNIKTFH
jgi:hypothetical protein